MPMANLKVMAFMSGAMEHSIKVNSKMELDMGMDNGFTAKKNMKASTSMIKEMDKVFINGMEGVIIRASSLMI